jgi:hypothetical protein
MLLFDIGEYLVMESDHDHKLKDESEEKNDEIRLLKEELESAIK